MREAFTFLAAFMEDADEMETVSRGEFYELLVKYALLGQEPDLSSCGVEVRIAFKHAKRMIDDGNEIRDARSAAGKSKRETNDNQNETNRKQTRNKIKQTEIKTQANENQNKANENQITNKTEQTISKPISNESKQESNDNQNETNTNQNETNASQSKSKSKSENKSESESKRESENPPSPPTYITPSLSLSSVSSGGTGEETEAREREGDGFEDFWDAYPRKESKVAARREWDAAVSTGRINAGNQGDVIASVKRHIDWDKQWRESKYIPFPASYIRDERWVDALKPPSDGSVSSSMDNVEAAWEAALQKSYAKLEPVTSKDFERRAT
jgi:hypothetical protein